MEIVRWREAIEDALARAGNHQTAVFKPGLGSRDIATLDRFVGKGRASGLRSLLLFANGVGLERNGVLEDWAIWPLDTVVSETLQARAEWDELDGMVVFSDAGADGILFAISLRAASESVYAWYPQEGRMEALASSLEEFLVGWHDGSISV